MANSRRFFERHLSFRWRKRSVRFCRRLRIESLSKRLLLSSFLSRRKRLCLCATCWKALCRKELRMGSRRSMHSRQVDSNLHSLCRSRSVFTGSGQRCRTGLQQRSELLVRRPAIMWSCVASVWRFLHPRVFVQFLRRRQWSMDVRPDFCLRSRFGSDFDASSNRARILSDANSTGDVFDQPADPRSARFQPNALLATQLRILQDQVGRQHDSGQQRKQNAQRGCRIHYW